MPPGIPGERRHPVAELDAVLLQPLRHLQRAGADFGVVGLVDRPLDRAGDDLALAVKRGGMVDDAMAQQRPILHQAEHGIPLLVLSSLGRRPSPVGARLAAGTELRNGLVTEIRCAGALVACLIPYKCRNPGQDRAHAGADRDFCGWPGSARIAWPRMFRCRARARRSGPSRTPFARPPAPILMPPSHQCSRPTATSGVAAIADIEPMPRLIGPAPAAVRDMVQLKAVLLAERAHRVAARAGAALRHGRVRCRPGCATRPRRAPPGSAQPLRSSRDLR